ncbi:unnamed protein product [Brassica napus]|uniref:(rape) hypothetical protein n=1 Tax=Brassica napus TaxID=3708 RepID=A0A816JWW8_BRANA|nr:unnamed protein product [Brassica napus]
MFLWVISLSYLCMRLLFRLLSCWFYSLWKFSSQLSNCKRLCFNTSEFITIFFFQFFLC